MFAVKSFKGLLALSSTSEVFQEQFSFSSYCVPKLCTCCPFSSISHTTNYILKIDCFIVLVLLDAGAFSGLIPCPNEAPDLPIHCT